MVYTVLPFEDLDEMDCLSDAEFGRLYRGLLRYVMTGEEPKISGNERFFWKRVKNRADRYRENFERSQAERSERGTKAAVARWNADASSSMQTDADASSSMQTDADASSSIQADACDAKANTNTNTKANKENMRFAPPSVEEVEAYCRERGNSVDPAQFVDFYASKGWKVGREPMKDWKAAVRTWEQRDKKPVGKPGYRAQQHNGELSELQKAAVERLMNEGG